MFVGMQRERSTRERQRSADEEVKNNELNGGTDLETDRQDRKDKGQETGHEAEQNRLKQQDSRQGDRQRETGRQTVTDGHADILYSTQRERGVGLGLLEKGKEEEEGISGGIE